MFVDPSLCVCKCVPWFLCPLCSLCYLCCLCGCESVDAMLKSKRSGKFSPDGLYLATTAQVATKHTMSLGSTVLGFDIFELWVELEGTNQLHCVYVQVSEERMADFPDVISGFYPDQKAEHKLSPSLIQSAKESPTKVHWKRFTGGHTDDEITGEGENTLANKRWSPLHPDLRAPCLTEMAYIVEMPGSDEELFLVGFSLDIISCKPSKMKFLAALGYTIYIAACGFDADDSTHDMQGYSQILQELDGKLDGIPKVVSNGDLPRFSNAFFDIVPNDSTIGEITTKSILKRGSRRTFSSHGGGSKHSATSDGSYTHSMWDPIHAFSYPIASLPCTCTASDDLSLELFSDVKHIANGSNSNVFLATFNSERVIIKMIKEGVHSDRVAVHEFDIEHSVLSRLDHPNIIKLKGAGRSPRRFIVLEYIEGGSLNEKLQQNSTKSGLAQRLFRRPAFMYMSLLMMTREMADAFRYLHAGVGEDVTIIHRDLKPDNVGFNADGSLKLFDFGLCTCVRKRQRSDEYYEMTGNTGSLRYMAPEVALKKPYGEKVDVYSFGILVWQMAKDKQPFQGFNKESFMKDVVAGGQRPKVDKSWPKDFSALLQSCWHADATQRPSFAKIYDEVDNFIDAENKKGSMWSVSLRK